MITFKDKQPGLNINICLLQNCVKVPPSLSVIAVDHGPIGNWNTLSYTLLGSTARVHTRFSGYFRLRLNYRSDNGEESGNTERSKHYAEQS
jgi:hypothetical protein